MNNNLSPDKIKSIVIDLEVSPEESMTYGPHHEAQVLRTNRPQYVFCFSYADSEKGKPKIVSLRQFPRYKRDPYNDVDVVKALHKVISEADRIISHNISFDMGMARARFMFHHLPPLPPVRTVCTLQTARRIGKFPGNSLKELAIFHGVTHKMETSKGLWEKIHYGRDPKAWAEMEKYNKTDVVVCREIHHVQRGWLTRPFPENRTDACKQCGGEFILQGTRIKKGGSVQRLQCKRCGSWSQTKNLYV